ncbi:RNA polymerase sigma factor [Spirosoma validum]|uniref:Sigma-70 family RNA polymerase sigma factor n=1 Tax=Spirosoma validum TaxID=2771355 RepID=A0A927GEY6_9BACT|nr:sigma-70 family RNA polymerase sigma factor [Spirosoma validum]MBD2755289.1 sigma-70 family RNA polymerase sigma factor [Spirosoma validum]
MPLKPQQPLLVQPHIISFEAFYNHYQRSVYRHCLRMVKDKNIAQDYTHDIFIIVFGALASFQHRSSYSSWLYSITNNYCIDQLRLGKRLLTISWQATELGHDQIEESEALLQEKRLQAVNQVMKTLSVESQTLLRLKYEAGMTIQELSDLHGLAPSTIKMRLKRSRDLVKRLVLEAKLL